MANVKLPKKVELSIYDVLDEVTVDELVDNIGEVLSDKYGFCHKGFKYDISIKAYDIDWDVDDDEDDDEYNSAVEELGKLDLDETEYYYYHQIIDDMHFNDKISAKNGKSGYDSYKAVIKSAKKTAKNK